MNVFCVNINNTNTQYGIVADNRLVERGAFPTPQLNDPRNGIAPVLKRIASREPRADGLSFGSVVPKAAEALQDIVESSGWNLPVHRLTWENCPIALNFPNPEEIGQDRLANAIAAQLLYDTPVIVIDMGTAVTFDIISCNGYEGGIIAPGLEIMTRYLHEQTALLPKLDPNDLAVDVGIGKSTLEAMKLGCAVGMRGMIRALLERIEISLEEIESGKATVIATGGSAGILPQTWLSDIAFNADITLIGLTQAFIHSRP